MKDPKKGVWRAPPIHRGTPAQLRAFRTASERVGRTNRLWPPCQDHNSPQLTAWACGSRRLAGSFLTEGGTRGWTHHRSTGFRPSVFPHGRKTQGSALGSGVRARVPPLIVRSTCKGPEGRSVTPARAAHTPRALTRTHCIDGMVRKRPARMPVAKARGSSRKARTLQVMRHTAKRMTASHTQARMESD